MYMHMCSVLVAPCSVYMYMYMCSVLTIHHGDTVHPVVYTGQTVQSMSVATLEPGVCKQWTGLLDCTKHAQQCCVYLHVRLQLE